MSEDEKQLEIEIEKLKEELNKLVSKSNVKLCEGDILSISIKLDKLIERFYEEKKRIF